MLHHGLVPLFITLGLSHFVLQILVYVMMYEDFFHFFSLTLFLILYDKNITISYGEIRTFLQMVSADTPN